jgi:hypothetical protein
MYYILKEQLFITMEIVYQFYHFHIFHQSLQFALPITSVVSLFALYLKMLFVFGAVYRRMVG